MRSISLTQARYGLICVIATCAMVVTSGLIAQTGSKAITTMTPSAATTPAATVSNETGQEENEVAAAKQELKDAKANAIKKADQRKTTRVAEDKNQARLNLWSPALVCQLSLGIGLFAVFILVCVTVLLKRMHDPVMPEQILRTFGILVIIFAAVFLVIAGYSDTQITPVIGLLGTIAGYLLGRKTDQAPSAGGGDGKSTSSDEKKSQHHQP